MATNEIKQVGRPKKTSVEEAVVNETETERLDMTKSGEENITIDEMNTRWKNIFNGIYNLDQYYTKKEAKVGTGKISPTITKWNKLNPFLQNERIKSLFTQPGTYSKQQLNEFLSDPAHHETELRAAGWTNSSSQQIYYNMLRRACDIPLYKYFVVPELRDKNADYKDKSFMSEYALVEEWLELLDIPCSLKTMALQVKREGKQSYLLRSRIDGNGNSRKPIFAAFEKMPTDWIKITGIGQLGYTISFNMMYFLNIANNPADFGEFMVAAWQDMLNQKVIDIDKDNQKFLNINNAKNYKFKYNGSEYTSMVEKVEGFKSEQYLFWLRMPYDMCFTIGSDNSHAWCAPDTMGALRALQELTDYGKLAGLIASTPLTALLTGEVEFIDGARAGKNETKLSPEVISGLQDIFNATTSTNVEAMFFPLSNIKLQQLATDVNSSEIISASTENFVETSGEGGLTVTTNKPNVSQVKTAQLLAASAQEYVTKQFQRMLNFVLQHKLGLKHVWSVKLWGDIFSFDAEKKYLKEIVAGGNIALLPKLMSADGISLRDTKAITSLITELDFYKDFKTFTQEAQAEAKKEEGSVGRPKLDDSEIENDSTSKDRDNGTNVEGNRENYSHKCPLCGAELEEGQEICDDCFDRLIAEKSE